MGTVITAPELFDPLQHFDPSAFLAGAIDMGAAVDWQSDVIHALRDTDIVLVNPRRAEFTPDTLDEQIRWELKALEDVDYVFMWFPKDAKAPISFFESGLYWRSSKLIVGAELGFYRRRNLEITAERYGVRLHSSIEDMIATLRESALPTSQAPAPALTPKPQGEEQLDSWKDRPRNPRVVWDKDRFPNLDKPERRMR